MKNMDLQLKKTDIATAVAYYGETELLDFIGPTRIEEYLIRAQADGVGTSGGTGPWAKMHLHQDVASAKIQLGDECKMIIQADFVNSDCKEVIIDVRMDRIFGVLLRRRASDVA